MDGLELRMNRQRAISLAAQRFISDIAETAVQLSDVQKNSKKKKVGTSLHSGSRGLIGNKSER